MAGITIPSVRDVRARLKLRPRDEVLAEIEARVAELSAKEGRMEAFAAEAGKRAARLIREVRTQEHVVIVLSSWTSLSAAEPEPDRRLVLMEIGAALLSTDFGVGI